MKRSRFTEEQIVGILKKYQPGLGAKDLCLSRKWALAIVLASQAGEA